MDEKSNKKFNEIFDNATKMQKIEITLLVLTEAVDILIKKVEKLEARAEAYERKKDI